MHPKNNPAFASRKEHLLSCFDARMTRPAVIEFAKRISEITAENEVTVIMARKAACFVECLRAVGLAVIQGPVISDRVLDWDCSWLNGKRIGVIDDSVISGSTLFRIRRQLENDHNCKVSFHALAVDRKWFRKDLFRLQKPYLKLGSEALTGVCADVVNAISVLPVPYASDFPLFTGIDVTRAELRAICSLSSYSFSETTSTVQAKHGAFSLAARLEQSAVGELDASLGWKLPPNTLVKLRIVGFHSGEQHVLSVLPIVNLPALSVGEIDELLHLALTGFQIEATILQSALPRSNARNGRLEAAAKAKLRLLSYWIGARLASRFDGHCRALLGRHLLESTANTQNLGYLVPPHVLAATKRVAESPNRLWSWPEIPTQPHQGRDHENHNEWIYGAGSQAANPHAIFGHLMRPFLELYKRRELPSREIVLRHGRAILEVQSGPPKAQGEFVELMSDIREYQKALNRLNEGFSFSEIVSWLEPVAQYIRSAHDIVSRFLDEVVDRGYIVPITFCGRVKGGETVVYRAYRHGEDILFNHSTKAALSQMLSELLRPSSGTVLQPNMASIRLTKSLALFIRGGLNIGILKEAEPAFARDCCDTLALRYWEHGVVPVVNPGDEIVTTGGNALLQVLASEGHLRSSGRPPKYELGDPIEGGLRASEIKGAANFGRLLRRIVSARNTEKGPAFTDWELALAATCYSPLDTTAAMVAEVEVIRHRLRDDERRAVFLSTVAVNLNQSLGRSEVSSNAADRLRAKVLGIVTPMHSGIWKWRFLRARRPQEIFDRMEAVFSDPVYRDLWKTYWPETHIQETDSVSVRLPQLMNLVARWLLRFATQWTMLELLHRYAALEQKVPGRAARLVAQVRLEEPSQRQLPFGWEETEEVGSQEIVVLEQRLVRCLTETHGFAVSYTEIKGQESQRLNEHLRFWIGLLSRPGARLGEMREKLVNRIFQMIDGPAEDIVKRAQVQCSEFGREESLYSLPYVLVVRPTKANDAVDWRLTIERLWEQFWKSEAGTEMELADRPILLPTFSQRHNVGFSMAGPTTSSAVAMIAFLRFVIGQNANIDRAKVLVFCGLPEELAPFKRSLSSDFGVGAFAEYLLLLAMPRFPIALPSTPGFVQILDFGDGADILAAELAKLECVAEPPTFISHVTPEDGPFIPLPGRSASAQLQPHQSVTVTAVAVERYDVGIITIVPAELHAVRTALERFGKVERITGVHDKRDFYRGTLASSGGQHRVVVGRTARKGQEYTTALFKTMDHEFHPRLMALVGISGGLSKKLGAADVAVGTEFIRYDHGEAVGGELLRRVEPWPMPEGWQQTLLERFQNENPDPIYLPTGSARFKVECGTIATGNQVVKDDDAEARMFLKSAAANALVLEMEAAGFLTGYADSRRQEDNRPEGFLVVRGVSDFANAGKNDEVRSDSATNAVVCLERLLGMFECVGGKFRL